MKIGVFGTGMVGQAIAKRLVSLGHDVLMGSRTADNEAAVGMQPILCNFEKSVFRCSDVQIARTPIFWNSAFEV